MESEAGQDGVGGTGLDISQGHTALDTPVDDISTEANEKKLAKGYLETWVANLGTCQERLNRCRELHFDESLGDIAVDLSSCLPTLPYLVETMIESNWSPNVCAGFSVITQLVTEAVQKTIDTLSDEREILIRQNAALRKLVKQNRQY